MIWHVPHPWEFFLLTLGGFRIVRGIGWDTLTEPLRRRLTGYSDDGAPSISDAERSRHGKTRVYISTLIRCPWCQGFYVAVILFMLWAWQGTLIQVLCVPLALSAAFGLIAKNLDP